jgi:hypothetical protein
MHVHYYPADTAYLKTGAFATRYALPLEWSSAGVLQGALVEEARTNLCLQSSNLTTTWANTNTTDAKNATGVTGVANSASTLTAANAAGVGMYVEQAITWTAATYTTSVIYKYASNERYVQINTWDGTTVRYANFDLLSGVVGTTGNATSTITALGNGFYRCSMTSSTNHAAASGSIVLAFIDSASSASIPTVTRTGTETQIIEMVQAEAGTFATSPIETFASTVTRAADNVSLATTAFPYGGGTANTVYTEFDCGPGYTALGGILGDASVDTFAYRSGASLVAYDGTDVHTYSGSALANNATIKAALAWSGTTSSSSTNGGTVQTGTAYRYTTVSSLVLGAIFGSAGGVVRLRKVMVLPRRQTNGELVTTTTP